MTHCRDQVRRIVESDYLSRSHSLIVLLEYLAEKSLEGRADQLKEYTIGVEALGKPSGYLPQSDASVRSQVRRLRAKLAQYYEETGAKDPIHLTLPRGGFELHFELRSQPTAAPQAEAEPRNSARRWRRLAWALAATVVVLLILLLGRPFDRPAASAASHEALFTADMAELWRPYLDSTRPTVICLGIPLFVGFERDGEIGGGSIRDPSLNGWDEGQQERLDRWRRIVDASSMEPIYRYMAVGEAMGAYRLGKSLLAGGLDVPVIRSPELTWDSIDSSNVIYLGAPKVNPQLRVESLGRHFRITRYGVQIENLSPLPGEPERFVETAHNEVRLVPALIGRYPARGGGGYVTAIGSGANLGVWGAVEYLTRPRYTADFVAQLRQAYGGVPEYFEAVVEATLVGGRPLRIRTRAIRELHPDDDASRVAKHPADRP